MVSIRTSDSNTRTLTKSTVNGRVQYRSVMASCSSSNCIAVVSINAKRAKYHRDYKRIEAASGNEPRNKLNKSNGGQI